MRQRLDEAFECLDLEDPDRHLRYAIACWPLEAVVNEIAILVGKRAAGTLPMDADGRYLRGIVKNLAEEAEGWQVAQALLRQNCTTCASSPHDAATPSPCAPLGVTSFPAISHQTGPRCQASVHAFRLAGV